MTLLLTLTACPSTLDALFGRDGEPPPGTAAVDGEWDTGTAFVVWHGSFTWDPAAERLEASRGYGAQLAIGRELVCDISADFESVGHGPVGCPDCTWSFTTRLIGGGTEGEYCGSFLQQTVFQDFSYRDFYFSSELDGFGWTESYLYSYGTAEYALEDVVWAHIDGTRYNGWYLYGYNLAGAVTGVFGDQYSAEFLRYAAGQNGRRAYYYFVY
jgi:hypothetical protein